MDIYLKEEKSVFISKRKLGFEIQVGLTRLK